MAEVTAGRCVVCVTPGKVHYKSCDVTDDALPSQSFCLEHVPVEFRDKLPIGPHKTAADEVSLLRTKLASLDTQVMDTSLREQIRAAMEQLIADIEAGKRRLSDLA